MELDDPNAFDKAARRFGWQYDNGGIYQGQSWDWYYSAAHQFGEAGNIVLARQQSGLTVVLHFRELSVVSEIWRGTVVERGDLEGTIRALDEYVAAHHLVPPVTR